MGGLSWDSVLGLRGSDTHALPLFRALSRGQSSASRTQQSGAALNLPPSTQTVKTGAPVIRQLSLQVSRIMWHVIKIKPTQKSYLPCHKRKKPQNLVNQEGEQLAVFHLSTEGTCHHVSGCSPLRKVFLGALHQAIPHVPGPEQGRGHWRGKGSVLPSPASCPHISGHATSKREHLGGTVKGSQTGSEYQMAAFLI